MNCIRDKPPKRAITAFFCYQRERKKTIKEENHGLDHKSLIRKMAEEWKNMSKQEKRKYIEESNEDKTRYRGERNKYNEKMKKQKEEKLKKIREQKEKEKQRIKEIRALEAFFTPEACKAFEDYSKLPSKIPQISDYLLNSATLL